MTSIKLAKEKIEIKIDSEEAIDNFGSETFEENILLFIDEGYNNYKFGIKKAQIERNQASMKMLTHTLKTTSRYMASENFAQVCHSIESETKSPNWEKIDELLSDFFHYLDLLYNECIKFYNDFKKDGEKKSPINIVEVLKSNFNNVSLKSSKKEEKNESPNINLQSSVNFNIDQENSSVDKLNSVCNNNIKFSSFKNCKSFNDSNQNEYEADNKIKIINLNKNKNVEDEYIENKLMDKKSKHNLNTNNIASFTNTYIGRRSSVLIENIIETGIEDNVNNIYINNKNKNINFDFGGTINLQSTRTMKFSNKNIDNSSIGNNMVTHSPGLDNNKGVKYSKIFNDTSIVCKESDINDFKSIKGGVYNSGISTPKFQSGNYEITSSKTDLNGNLHI